MSSVTLPGHLLETSGLDSTGVPYKARGPVIVTVGGTNGPATGLVTLLHAPGGSGNGELLAQAPLVGGEAVFDITSFAKFLGVGEWDIRVTYGGSALYHGRNQMEVLPVRYRIMGVGWMVEPAHFTYGEPVKLWAMVTGEGGLAPEDAHVEFIYSLVTDPGPAYSEVTLGEVAPTRVDPLGPLPPGWRPGDEAAPAASATRYAETTISSRGIDPSIRNIHVHAGAEGFWPVPQVSGTPGVLHLGASATLRPAVTLDVGSAAAAAGEAITLRATVVDSWDEPVHFYSDRPQPDTWLATVHPGDPGTSGYPGLLDGKPWVVEKTVTLPSGVHHIDARVHRKFRVEAGRSESVTVSVGMPELQVVPRPEAITYGDADPSFDFTITGFESGDDIDDLTEPPQCGVAEPHADAGTYTISCTPGSSPAYAFDTSATATLTVEPKTLVVLPQSELIPFGAPEPGFEPAIVGFVEGQTVADLVEAPTCGVAGSHTEVGSYVITCEATDAGNYRFDTSGQSVLQVVEGTTSLALSVPDDWAPGSPLPVTARVSPVAPSVAIPTGEVHVELGGEERIAQLVDGQATVVFDDPGTGLLILDGTFRGSARWRPSLAILHVDAVEEYVDVRVGLHHPLSAVAGTPATAMLSISNHGTTVAEDVAFESALAPTIAGLTFTANAFGGASGHTETGSGDLAEVLRIPPGGRVDFEVSGTWRPDGVGVGLTAVRATLPDGVENRSAGADVAFGGVTFEQQSDLAIAVEGPATADVGEVVTYGVTVRNEGPSDVVGASVSFGLPTLQDEQLEADGGFVEGLEAIETFEDGHHQARFNLPAGRSLHVSISGAVPASAVGLITRSVGVDDPHGTDSTDDRDEVVTDVRPIPQTITFPQPADTTYGADPATLLASASSELPVRYVSSGACLVDGAAVRATGAGTCTITAHQDGNSTFAGAAPVARSFTVAPAALVVRAPSPSMAYGSPELPLLVPTYEGLVGGDTGADAVPVCATTATVGGDAGSYAVTCKDAGDPDYAITYAQGTLQVVPAPLTVVAPSASMTYGDAVPPLAPTYEGLVNGDLHPAEPATCETDAAPTSDVGTYEVRCIGAEDPNYAIDEHVGSLEVVPAELTVVAPTGRITYGDALPALVPDYVGLVGADTEPDQPATCATTAEESSAPGTYVVTCGDASDPNYHVQALAGELTIDRAPVTVQAPTLGMVFGEEVPELVPTYVGLVHGDDLDTAASCSTDATSQSPVGLYVVTCAGASDPSYLVKDQSGSIRITPAQLTVIARSLTSTYGAAIPALEPSYSGIDGQPETGAVCSTTATAASGVGTYPVTCRDAADPDFIPTYVAGQIDIVPAPLTVVAPTVSSTYGDVVPSLRPSYVGLRAGDLAPATTPTCTTSATAASGVGTYEVSCSGAADPNYEVDHVAGSVVITPRTLVVTAPSPLTVYGDPVPALLPSYDGLVHGQVAPVTLPTCTTEATAGSSAGSYTVRCRGAADPNHRVIEVDGTLRVTPASLTVSAAPASRSFGQANPALQPTFSGFVLGQTLATSGVTGKPTCATPATPTSPVGTYPITCTRGTLSSTNYDLGFVPSTLSVARASTRLDVDAVLLNELRLTVGPLSARLTSAGTPLAGETVTFLANGTVVCSAKTKANGIATCTAPLGKVLLLVLTGGVNATFAGSTNHNPSSGANGLIQ